MRYILYARKSSESEDRQAQSIDDQVKALDALARQRGFTVVDRFVESRSAKAPGERPVFTLLLEQIRQGRAEAILCWNLNRLSRNPVDSGTLSWLLQQGELKAIQTVEREYRPEDNVVLMAVESGVANQFILDLKKAVARGTQSKLDKGWFPHRAPEGYLNHPLERTIVADPERFALLRRAWELMLTGTYTVPQVLAELDAWGYRTRKGRKIGGKAISRSSLYELFDNPFYCGKFLREGTLHQGAHPPMVSQDEWERVQQILHRPNHIQPQKHEFAFTGLIRCGVCGCLVTAERHVKHYKTTGNMRTYVYYHCTGRKGCRKTAVTEAYIEATIEDALEQCALNPVVTQWMLGVLKRYHEEQAAPEHALYAMQQQALLAAHKRLDGLFAMRADQEISREEFAARKEAVEAEIAGVKEEIGRWERKRQRDLESMENALDFAATAYARFTQGNVRAKREVADKLGFSYVLTLGTLEIEPDPILDLIRRFEPVKSGSGKVKKEELDPQDAVWWGLADNIRTYLAHSDVYFSRLKCA